MAFIWNPKSQSDVIEVTDIHELRNNINTERVRRYFQPYNFLAPLTDRVTASSINELITAMNGIAASGIDPVTDDQYFEMLKIQNIKNVLDVFNGKTGVPHYQWVWKGVRTSYPTYYSTENHMNLAMYWNGLVAYTAGHDGYGYFGYANSNTKLYLSGPVQFYVGDTTVYSTGRMDYEITSWTWE